MRRYNSTSHILWNNTKSPIFCISLSNYKLSCFDYFLLLCFYFITIHRLSKRNALAMQFDRDL